MQKRTKKISANEVLRRRIQKWEDEDPSSLLTKHIEKTTAPLQWLVELLLPETLVQEAVEKTLWAAEQLTDRQDVLKFHQVTSVDQIPGARIEHCDAIADQVHNWAVGAGAALGAWDVAGPLTIAPSLASLFTLAFRTVKKIGLCYGFDTSKAEEEMIVLQIFAAASTLYHRDKVAALKEIEAVIASSKTVGPDGPLTRDTLFPVIAKLAKPLCLNMIHRRTFAAIPAMGAIVAGSTNAWLLQDVGWAARNVYALRRLDELKNERDAKQAARVTAKAKKEAEAAAKEAEKTELPKAA